MNHPRSDALISAILLKYGHYLCSKCDYSAKQHLNMRCVQTVVLAWCRLGYYGIWYYKTQTLCFLFSYWLGHERATSELLYRWLSYRNIATDFRSKLWNRPHEDSWITVCCITDPLRTKITMSVYFKNSLTGIRGPINVSRLCAQNCRAIKHSSVTSSKRHREKEKRSTDNTVLSVIIIRPHFCFHCT